MKEIYNYQPPLNEGLDILYQDTDILILSKPSGLLSVPGRSACHKDCLESRVQEHFPSARIVHRLDMDTSGIMVMALNEDAHRALGKQFENREVEKSYIAEIWGQPENDSGRIDLPLRCDWPNRPRQMVDHELGKHAVTDWEISERGKQTSRVVLKPITGRSHQLRVHMLELGHPILGDDLYAHEKALNAADRLYLHAQELAFKHPASGDALSFHSPCPF
jgi:tRNA pseudouridine32 synthase/23S rRNA pseudouridine746 synthase